MAVSCLVDRAIQRDRRPFQKYRLAICAIARIYLGRGLINVRFLGVTLTEQPCRRMESGRCAAHIHGAASISGLPQSAACDVGYWHVANINSCRLSGRGWRLIGHRLLQAVLATSS